MIFEYEKAVMFVMLPVMITSRYSDSMTGVLQAMQTQGLDGSEEFPH